MEKGKDLLSILCSLLCALVLSVSVLDVSDVYFGNSAYYEYLKPYLSSMVADKPFLENYDVTDVLNIEANKGYGRPVYDYYVVLNYDSDYDGEFDCLFCYASSVPIYIKCKTFTSGVKTKYRAYLTSDCGVYEDEHGSYNLRATMYSENGFDWFNHSSANPSLVQTDSSGNLTENYGQIVYANHDVCLTDGTIVYSANGNDTDVPSYNSDLGYLQNVRVNHVFEEVSLGENANEKWVSKWYFDSLSTTGIDLSSGNYSINYYEERWIVTGYEEEDVVEKSDRYLLATVNARDGYFTTNSQHIEEFLQGQGYEEPNFFDLWFNKFVTTHYYLQIVDNATQEVGGYVHIYLTDDNGKFGVELIGESTDLDGNLDEDGYNDFIEEGKITTDDVEAGFEELENNNEQTLEEWFENLTDTNGKVTDDIDGTDNLSNAFLGFGNEVSQFSLALGQFLGCFPSWVLLSLGIGACLLFLGIVYKALRG